MRRDSIRRRLERALLATAALVGVVAGAVVFILVRAALLHEADVALRARAGALVPRFRWESGRIEADIEPTALPEYFGPQAAAWFRCELLDGRTIAASPLADHANGAARGRGRVVSLEFKPTRDEEEREVGAAEPPTLRLTVAGDAASVDHALAILAAMLAATGAVILAVAPAIARYGVLRLLTPLSAVSEFADRLRPEDRDHRVDIGRLPLELEPIAARLNALADRMVDAYERERRFAGDIAHELRTPVAELRALSEAALTWPAAITDPAAHQALIHRAAVRLQTIVSTLLDMQRRERGAIDAMTLVPTDLAAVVEALWKERSRAADARGIGWTLDAVRTLVITEPDALSIVVANLLANAAEYTPSGGRVAITVSDDPPAVVVANDAPQVTAADLAFFGQRLWRKDGARSAGHCGLGLALAGVVCTTLDLRLTHTLDERGRVVATIAGFRPSRGDGEVRPG